MNLSKNYRLYAMTLLSLIVLGGVVGYAQSFGKTSMETRPELKVTLSGMVNRDDKQISLSKVGNVNPGEIINWTIDSVNTGNAPAQSQDAIAQIPNGTTYVVNSADAKGPFVVSYSIDGGKTFSAQPMITEHESNGTVKQVPAPVSMYNQIRFHWDTQLTASEERNAAYSVRVK